MSPQATDFWRKVREVVKNIDLNDYGKVESQLSLDTKYRRPLARPMQFSYPSFLPRCCFHMPVGQKSQRSSHRFALQSAQALVLCRALLEKAAAN